jgi:hypothetical protein
MTTMNIDGMSNSTGNVLFRWPPAVDSDRRWYH